MVQESKFRIVEQITEKKVKNGKKVYYYFSVVECNTCGYSKKIYKNDVRHMMSCKMCNIKTHTESFVDYMNDMYKVLAFSHQIKNRLYYLVECRRCKSVITMRKDAIIKDGACSCIVCKSNGIKSSIKAPLNVYQYYYMSNAKKRNLEWELSHEEFKYIVTQSCAYCGSKPAPMRHLKRYTKVSDEFFVNGIDRINTDTGYTVENCTPCCTMCNRMKLDHSKKMFLEHVSKIYKHHEKFNDYPEKEYSASIGRGSGEGPEKDHDIV